MQHSLDSKQIRPCGPVRAAIRPPGSKSITNRALICAALSEGESTLRGALTSEDTEVMVDSLRRLGLTVMQDPAANTIKIFGKGLNWAKQDADLFIGNSGTSVRFLTAMLSAGHGGYRLDGVPRMRQRPIGDLLSALKKLGVQAHSENHDDCPPVHIQAKGLTGGTTTIRGDISSQFLSALMMAAPYATSAITLEIEGELVSKPYVEMTLAVMQAFGVNASRDGWKRISIPPAQYQAREYSIEPDASAASYFWAAAAVTGGEVTVEGLTSNALQGDVRFTQVLAQMGCAVSESASSITVRGGELVGVDIDMNEISDTVQTLAIVALFAKGATRIRNVAHIRHKETDRVGDLARELRKLGAEVREREDGLEIIPGQLRPASIATYNDHRMAMSFAIAGLRIPGVVIENPGCTAKTYPNFFEDLDCVCR
jgi:3-phosphoshikimate 1-carboxyvinyltransferase